MIKDVVVHLSVGENGGPAGDYAISLAGALGAHLTAIAFVYDPIVPVSGMGYIPAEVVETQQADSAAAAKAAIDRFAKAAESAGVAVEPVTLGANFASASDQFGRIVRRFDLAIVGQADGGAQAVDATIAEAALLEGACPVIIVPYIQKVPFKLDKVMVCWDGSPPAARAIANAMPLLTRAGLVEVVIVADEHGEENELAGADLGQHLARHDIKVEVNRIARGDIDIGEALLSHAADSGADFLVMGGYGHARLRELVFGGVTADVLRSMTVPTLMSH